MVVVVDVRDAGEDREFAAMLLEMPQVAGALVFQPGGLGKQEGCVQTKVATNEEEYQVIQQHLMKILILEKLLQKNLQNLQNLQNQLT
jgi:hypothetical protein